MALNRFTRIVTVSMIMLAGFGFSLAFDVETRYMFGPIIIAAALSFCVWKATKP